MRLAMGKPKPIPLALVVKSGTQSLLNVSGDIPIPVSLKTNFTLPFTALLVMVKVPVTGSASIELEMCFVVELNPFLSFRVNKQNT